MTFKLITAPTAEPITASDLKAHLRKDTSDEDALITALIVAAREQVEHLTGRALMPQTWDLLLDEFPDGDIALGKLPVASITSVSYTDIDGATQTVSSGDYVLDADALPGWVRLAYGKSWPSTRDVANAVAVRFVAGYANAAAVPQSIKQAMFLMCAHWFENRELTATRELYEIPVAANALLQPSRLRQGV